MSDMEKATISVRELQQNLKKVLASVERGQVVAIDVVGDGLAPEGTTAVSLNLAVDGPERAGFLTAFPCGVDRPWAASLDFAGGQTASNEVVVGVGTSDAADDACDGGAVGAEEEEEEDDALR